MRRFFLVRCFARDNYAASRLTPHDKCVCLLADAAEETNALKNVENKAEHKK